MKTGLLAAFWIGLLALAGGFAWHVWRELGEVEISNQGYLALALGVTATAALGIGLMALLFYSHRRGYDDIDRDGKR